VLTKTKERKTLANKKLAIGFTICKPPMQDQDITNQSLPKIKQIENRKKKMDIRIKPELTDNLERKMYISQIESPIDVG